MFLLEEKCITFRLLLCVYSFKSDIKMTQTIPSLICLLGSSSKLLLHVYFYMSDLWLKEIQAGLDFQRQVKM